MFFSQFTLHHLICFHPPYFIFYTPHQFKNKQTYKLHNKLDFLFSSAYYLLHRIHYTVVHIPYTLHPSPPHLLHHVPHTRRCIPYVPLFMEMPNTPHPHKACIYGRTTSWTRCQYTAPQNIHTHLVNIQEDYRAVQHICIV